MKQYSQNQQMLLNRLTTETISVNAYAVSDDLRYLEQEQMIVRASLKEKIITYSLSAKGAAYLAEYATDETRYAKSRKLAISALVVSILAFLVSLASFMLSLLT